MSDICYNYHPITGEYIGQSTFRRDPIERLPLVPAHATLIAPPDPVAGMVAVFSGAAWSLVEDHRGESGYVNGEPVTIAALGPLPEGWSAEPPAPDLDTLKANKRDEAKSKMDAFLAALQPEYGQYSIATWDVQAQEADGLLAGTLTEAECPGLAALVAGRVISGGATLTVTEQAQRIQANRQQWRAIGLFVEGQRNGIMDQVQAATTPEQVQAIEVAYSLPEQG